LSENEYIPNLAGPNLPASPNGAPGVIALELVNLHGALGIVRMQETLRLY